MTEIERIARILHSIDFPPEKGFDFDNGDPVVSQKWYRRWAARLIERGFDIVKRGQE